MLARDPEPQFWRCEYVRHRTFAFLVVNGHDADTLKCLSPGAPTRNGVESACLATAPINANSAIARARILHFQSTRICNILRRTTFHNFARIEKRRQLSIYASVAQDVDVHHLHAERS